MATRDITPQDIAKAQLAIDTALADQRRGVKLDLNPDYLNDPVKLAKEAKDVFISYGENALANNQNIPISRPFLYTTGEMVERISWTLLTDYGETNPILKIRDMNVQDYLQAFGEQHYLPASEDFEMAKAYHQIMSRLAPETAEKVGPEVYAILMNRSTALGDTISHEQFISSDPTMILGKNYKNLTIPRELIEEYMRQFNKWWNKGTGIRSLLYKFFTGAITEVEFNNAVLKFKGTADYEDGFYDEEMEV